jgi:3-oxoacyl-(acyl-carrier-protein) reductase
MGGELCSRAGVVTGASRGIGRAIALELARNGASVAVGYSHNAEGAEAVAREIQALGCEAVPLKADVQDPEEVKSAIASVAEHFGKIDFLVNNAGIARDRTLAKMTYEDWSAVINVDLHSVFNVTHEVLPYMLQQNFGRIINVSSVVAQAGNFGQTNYAAAKAGVIGFTKSAALELAGKGITINCLAPGFTETDMVGAMPEPAKQKVLEHIPMGRFGRPEEMAHAATFLIAHGDYITGQVIAVNGGLYV